MVASNTLPSIFLTDLSKVYRKTQECRVFLNNRKKFFIANLRDTLPNFHHGFPESTRSTDDLATRLQDLIVDASPPEYVNDDSSFGYDPSDDTLETSSAFYNDQGSYEKRDPVKFSYSRPKCNEFAYMKKQSSFPPCASGDEFSVVSHLVMLSYAHRIKLV